MSEELQAVLDLSRGSTRGKCVRMGVNGRQLTKFDIWMLRRALERQEWLKARSNEGCVQVKVLSHDRVPSRSTQETFVIEACPIQEPCPNPDESD